MHSSGNVFKLLVGVMFISSILSIFPRTADSAPEASAVRDAEAAAASKEVISMVDLMEALDGVGVGSDSDEAKLELEPMSVDQLLHLVHRVLKMRQHGASCTFIPCEYE